MFELVLFHNRGCQPALLPADCVHDRRAPAVECICAALDATGQRASHDGALSWWSAGSFGAFPAISFSAVKVVGKHGRASRGFSGWANAGERRPVVPDGAGAQTLSLAGRITFGHDRVRTGARSGAVL